MREDATTTDDFLTYNASEFDPSFAVLYVWDEPQTRNPNWSYWKVIGNSGFSSAKPELDQAYLQPGQGFLVRAKTGGGTMSFTQDMRIHDHTASSFKTAREPWPGLNLLVNNETETTSTAITFHAGMTKGLDITYDAGLFGGNPKFSLYSRLIEDNGINFMLQCLPDEHFKDMIIPLGFDYKDGGIVTFTAETVGLDELCGVVLEDRLLNIFTDLSDESSSYSTTVDANSFGIGRFYLHTYTIPQGPADPMDPSGPDDPDDPADPADPSIPMDPVSVAADQVISFYIYSANGDIFVVGDMGEKTHAYLFNLSGSLIRTYDLMPSSVNILPAGDIRQGMYFINLSGTNINETRKIVLNQ